MKTKPFLYSLLMFALLLTSCDFGKERRLRNIADRPPISVVSTEPTPQSRAMFILDSLAAINVNRNLITSEVKSNPTFSERDWRNVQTLYNNWRRNEIRSGNFLERCAEWDDAKNDWEWESEIQYALPDISTLTHLIDTIKVDINFDGRKDVVFIVQPMCCWRTRSRPRIYLLFVSDGTDRFVRSDFLDFLINRVENTLESFRKEFSEWTRWFAINNVQVVNGVIEISGRSAFDFNLGRGWTGIVYDFTARMDKEGNGYIVVNGVYCRDNYFELVLAIK